MAWRGCPATPRHEACAVRHARGGRLAAPGQPGAGAWALLAAGGFVLVESGFTPAAFGHLGDLTQPLDGSRGAALGLYSLFLGLGQLAGNVVGRRSWRNGEWAACSS